MVADSMHALPWYFGAAFFAGWALVMVGLLVLVRRRLRARAERRRALLDHRRGADGSSAVIRDDRSLGSGGDLERW